MRPPEPIVQALADRRRELGINRRAAAARAGVSPATWTETERGRHAPSAVTLTRMAAGLGCDVVLVLRNPEPESAEEQS